MELHELKKIWEQFDSRLDQQPELTAPLLQATSLNKVRSLLSQDSWTALFESFVSGWFIVFLLGFMADHLTEVRFVIPAAALLLFSFASLAWSLYRLRVAYSIRYPEPVAEVQARLQRIRLYTRRQYKLFYIIFPGFLLPFVLVLGKALLGLDLYAYLDVLLLQALGSILLVPLVIWLLNKFPDQGLESALVFLEEIRRFQDEA